MNVLMLSPLAPYPCQSGHDLRVYHLGRGLAAHHRVHLVYQDDRAPEPDTLAHLQSIFAGVAAFAPDPDQSPPHRSGWAKVRECWDVTPADLPHFRVSTPLRAYLAERVADGGWDLVWLAGWYLYPYLADLGDLPRLVEVCDDPNLLFRRMIRTRRGWLDRLRAARDWLVLRRFEQRYFPRFGQATVISPIDARSLSRLAPGLGVHVVANGVDCEWFTPGPAPPPGRPWLLFSGVMDYEPNADGARHLCRDILPLVRRRVPEVGVRLVGRRPGPAVRALHDPAGGVEVLADLPDLRPEFDRATLYVCPLRAGAGMKNKILEAWAMAKATVATPMSADGIEVEPDGDIVLARTPARMAEAIVRLLGDPARRAELGRRGRAKALTRYSWAARGRQLARLVERLARPAGGPATAGE